MGRSMPQGWRPRARAEAPGVREKFLLFRVGSEMYGMALRGLREVLLSDDVALLPASPTQVCIALAHRGRRIPVIRMRAMFEGAQAGMSATARVLLTEGRGGAMGLLVDEVLEMVEVDAGRIAPVPALATLLDPACFRGLFTQEDRVILLVDQEGLAGTDEIRQFHAAGV